MRRFNRPSNSRTRAILAPLLISAALLAGCSEWVVYDDDFVPRGGTASTLDDFSATKLQHLKLRGLMSGYVSAGKDSAYVLVDYLALDDSDEARYTLEQYLNVLASVDPSKLVSKNERYAYWINAYNAGVITGVINAFGGSSSYKVTDSSSFFDKPNLTVGGQKAMTANHIEQGVLRGAWDHASIPKSGALLAQLKTWHKELWSGGSIDARFHAAVNCAALSCPNLLAAAPYAYDPATLDKQLDAAVKQWLDSADKGAGPGGVSKLFDWYKSDFEASHGSVDKFIAAFRTEGLKNVSTSSFLTYDWTLNIRGAK
jgi:Protein of unknown function, DUF547